MTTGERLRRKRAALERGRKGEWLAAFALQLRGYRIVTRNFRCKAGEIDIIARRRDLVLFVEVKARSSIAAAVDAVSHDSQRRIANAADFWMSRQRDQYRLSWRFDIIAVLPRRWPVHLEDAF
ncbi:MAG: YraN family protein [Nitratireductor sp.]